MNNEKNGTESEHSVTSSLEKSATDDQQKVSVKSGKEEIVESTTVESVGAEDSQRKDLEQRIQKPEKVVEETEPENQDQAAAVEPTLQKAEDATPDPDLISNQGIKDSSTEESIEKHPLPTLEEQKSPDPEVAETSDPKLVTETSERSKEIDSEEIIPVAIENDSPETPDSEPAIAVDDTKSADAATPSAPEGEEQPPPQEVAVKEEHPIDRHDDDERHEDYEEEDFTKYTKEQLVDVIKQLGKDDKPIRADRILKRLAPLFSQIRDKEKAAAFEEFKANGGEVADFSFRPDELTLRFDANCRLIKDRRAQFIKKREREKQSNLGLAEVILNKLRAFVDSDESSVSFDSFKAIQEEWKAIGDIPGQHSRSLWANYNALIHRFYDQRSIYFELKELDRRHNYDAKIKLCERAEALENEPIIREAIKALNELHYDYKHLGPVPRELQEELWVRFKQASDKIYEKRKDYVSELKTELQDNFLKKQALAEEITPLGEFNSDQIKEWNEKSREILEIQKRWDKVGGLPKEKAKVINKKFWSTFKSFFNKKKIFFKQLESEREANLKLKKVLVEKAEALKESTDWHKTANEFKALQQEWREIGPVPGKLRNEIYEEFKKACDYFFEGRRAGSKEAESGYKENLKNKQEIIAKIKSFVDSGDKEIDELKSLAKSYSGIGFVPKKNIGKLKQDFEQAVDAAITANSSLVDDQKETLAIELKMGEVLKGENSEKVLYQKEQNLRRQINKIENEVALWVNNLEFFRNSKSANKLRDEFNDKIDKANEELDHLKRQLKAYRKL